MVFDLRVVSFLVFVDRIWVSNLDTGFLSSLVFGLGVSIIGRFFFGRGFVCFYVFYEWDFRRGFRDNSCYYVYLIEEGCMLNGFRCVIFKVLCDFCFRGSCNG